VRRCVATFFPATFTRVFEDYAAGRKSRAPKTFAAVPGSANERDGRREKSPARTIASLRFHRTRIGSADETLACHAAAAGRGVNEVAGIHELQLIRAAVRPDPVNGSMIAACQA
jgi:hypothetical protein